jgi:hypothetical protein
VVRGFWTIPAPAVPTFSNVSQVTGKPQQIVKFDVEFKKLAADGSESPLQTFRLYDTSVNTDASSTAVFSNWEHYPTLAAIRTYDASTNTFSWLVPNQNDANNIDINQISIPIEPDEILELRVRSISEVGYPEAPLYSDWSNIIRVAFPNSLLNSYQNAQDIITKAMVDNAKNEIMQTLNNQGLNQLLSQRTIIDNNTYFLSSDAILSGFRDSNNRPIDLYDYLNRLANSIADLEARIFTAQGKLQIRVYNGNNYRTIDSNSTNTTLSYIVYCEKYCSKYESPGVPSGKVYANNIYVIKDFFVEVANITPSSSLELLSDLNYNSGVTNDIVDNSAPQVFWVDDKDELITVDTGRSSQTQVNNQFIWSVNSSSVNSSTKTAYSQDIGNSFASVNRNSITNVLQSTQYNIGYAQNSILGFVGNNKSLLETSKWIDTVSSVSSQTKFLTTIHPVVPQITDLVDTSSTSSGKFVHSLSTVNTLNIPINIYFKMNSLDNTKTGANYQYINLNGVTQNQRHVKYLKFYLKPEKNQNPIQFTLKFSLNMIDTTGINLNAPIANNVVNVAAARINI